MLRVLCIERFEELHTILRSLAFRSRSCWDRIKQVLSTNMWINGTFANLISTNCLPCIRNALTLHWALSIQKQTHMLRPSRNLVMYQTIFGRMRLKIIPGWKITFDTWNVYFPRCAAKDTACYRATPVQNKRDSNRHKTWNQTTKWLIFFTTFTYWQQCLKIYYCLF